MRDFFYEHDADALYHFNFHSAESNYVSAHFHRSMELAFVRKGSAKIVINSEEKILHEGEISFANGYDIHYYDGRGGSSLFILVFGDRYGSDPMLAGKRFDNFLTDRERNKILFEFLGRLPDDGRELNELLKKGIVNTVLGVLVDIYGLREKQAEEKYTFTEVLAYLEEHFREDITLEELAARFGYTKNYFSTLFNRFTGMHLRNYLNNLRVEKVNKLLESDKTLTVTNAVFACGFNSLNTYYRALRRKNS